MFPLDKELAYSGRVYRRWTILVPTMPLRAHWIEFLPDVLISLSVAQDALRLDMSKESARRDVPGTSYVGRRGFYVSRVCRIVRDTLGDCLVFNGNNIGYWGNQFAIQGGALVFKANPPIFFDPSRLRPGPYWFAGQMNNGEFILERMELTPEVGTDQRTSWSVSSSDASRLKNLRCALSGFPLIIDGRPVWRDYVEDAWDPKLLYRIGDVQGLDPTTFGGLLRAAANDGRHLERHALTFLAKTETGGMGVLLAEEGSASSAGLALDAGAALLSELGAGSAIVLGGKGDVQAVSSEEGALLVPLISSHDREDARPLDAVVIGQRPDPIDAPVLERPVASVVVVHR
jgi:hypothetical protein